MILDSRANADRYTTLHPLFARAFNYLGTTNLAAIASGRFNIEGENFIAIFSRGAGRQMINRIRGEQRGCYGAVLKRMINGFKNISAK